jgi:hypothetical protein
VPSLLLDSALSGRLILFGGSCLAAEERLLRCPAEAEKEDWEASVTLSALNGRVECNKDAGVWLAATRKSASYNR